MYFVESSEHTFQKKLLKLAGLWHNPRPRLRTLRVLFIYFVLVFGILFQLTLILSSECDFGCALRILSSLLLNVLTTVKYVNFHACLTTVETLFAEIQIDWEFLKDDQESIEILREYANNVRVFTMLLTLLLICMIGVSVTLATFFIYELPDCYSLLKAQLFVAEYFGPQTYTRAVTFCIILSLSVNCFLVIATETSVLSLLEHLCGMFRIVGLFKILWNKFEVSYVVVFILGIGALSSNLMCFLDALNTMDDMTLLTISSILLFVLCTYLFFTTYYGQRLIDHSIGIFYDAYDSSWYEIPLEIQKFYLFILRRSINSCALAKKGFFISSMEGLTSMLNATFSYFMLFQSVQK